VSYSEDIVESIKKKKISELLAEDKRLDGREALDFRSIKVETGTIGTAAGSSLVSLGNTKVMTGIKIETGLPFPDKPQDGVLTTNVELVPLASPNFEAGPPREDSIELARVVDRGIREAKVVDLGKLCIDPGKLVFVVYIDLYVLDHDGNLFDAFALSAISALLNTKMRKYSVTKDGEVTFKKGYLKLPLQNYPVEISIGMLDGKMIVDPTLEEEVVVDGLLTIAIGKEGEICAMQKRETGIFSVEEILRAVTIAQKKARELRENILGELIDEYEKA
jgi:exosome complex component RRP42